MIKVLKRVWRMVAVAGTIMILGGIGALVINRTLLPKLATNSVAGNWSWVKQSAERTTIVNKTEEVVVRPDNAMRSAVSNVRPAVVQVIAKSNSWKSAQISSGVILSSDGVIATQLAVAPAKNAKFTVLMNSGAKHTATIAAIDQLTGIVFLRIADVTNLPAVTFMKVQDVFLAQSMVAVGATDAQNSRAIRASVADIAFDRSLSVAKSLSSDKFAQTIQVEFAGDVVIGAGLFNSRSEFVGLVMRDGDGDVVRVVAVDMVDDAWRRLLKDKLSAQAVLGIEYLWLSPTVAAARSLEQDTGVLVTAVAKKSAAARGSVYSGDVIVKVGDIVIDDSAQLAWVLRNYQSGEVVRLQVLRSGQDKQLLISL